MESLKFIVTKSVAKYKAQKGIKEIDVKQNSQNRKKLLCLCLCETGAVSDKFANG